MIEILEKEGGDAVIQRLKGIIHLEKGLTCRLKN